MESTLGTEKLISAIADLEKRITHRPPTRPWTAKSNEENPRNIMGVFQINNLTKSEYNEIINMLSDWMYKKSEKKVQKLRDQKWKLLKQLNSDLTDNYDFE